MGKKKIVLSVALAVMNEESNISSCLSSIVNIADEIVVVDGGSTDRTVDIAKKYNAKIIETDNPPIFHINKQKALDACKGDWILQLDADEVATLELRDEIAVKIKNTRYNAYYIPRRNNFWGHFMRKGGQYPDYVIRLMRRGKAKFPCKSVHEQIEIEGEVGYLKEPLLHYAYRTTADYWRKGDAYMNLRVKELEKKEMPCTLFTWLDYTIYKPVYIFFSLFVRHKGFVDGVYGFLFALFSALDYPISYGRYCNRVKKSKRR